MRQILIATLALSAGAAASQAQVADRYGGAGDYRAAAPAPGAPVRGAPGRVLSWPGKSLPATAPQVGGYGDPRMVQPQAVYAYPVQAAPAGARPQAAYPSPYQPQPYFAPAPAPAPAAPGSSATAPSGVYPPNTVPPQLASPFAVPPQQAAPLVGSPQPPVSIYGPPQARMPGPTDPGQPQRIAANTAQPQAARYYSVHRPFGLQPDPAPAAAAEGQPVELVSSIDSGVGAEPASEPRNRVVQTRGKAGTTVLRGPRDADPDAN